MTTNTTKAQATLSCDGWCHQENPVTHIGSKGYVYCKACATTRRNSGYERTRRMTAAEREMLLSGQPLPRY